MFRASRYLIKLAQCYRFYHLPRLTTEEPHLQRDPDREQGDRGICDRLRHDNFEVIEIPVGNLNDRAAMAKYFFRLGRILLGKQQAAAIRDRADWFDCFI